MKLLPRSLVATLTLAFGLAVSAAANNAAFAGGGAGCGCGGNLACGTCNDCCGYDSCCNTCCDGGVGWGLFGEAEMLFLRYHRADGVRVGDAADEGGEFDFEITPRFSLGVVAPGGLGFRTRYFEFDHFETMGGAGNGLGVDTYTFDFELFEAFELNPVWALEISGGIRYNRFQETMTDNTGDADFRSVTFDGVGLVSGLEARRAVGFGLLYARTRMAVVQGDKHLFNSDDFPLGVANTDNTLTDVTTGMLEIAVGGEVNYELSNGSVLFARSGLEWQNWWNVSNAFVANVNPAAAGIGESVWGAASDVGFAGFTFAAGVSY